MKYFLVVIFFALDLIASELTSASIVVNILNEANIELTGTVKTLLVRHDRSDEHSYNHYKKYTAKFQSSGRSYSCELSVYPNREDAFGSSVNFVSALFGDCETASSQVLDLSHHDNFSGNSIVFNRTFSDNNTLRRPLNDSQSRIHEANRDGN